MQADALQEIKLLLHTSFDALGTRLSAVEVKLDALSSSSVVVPGPSSSNNIVSGSNGTAGAAGNEPNAKRHRAEEEDLPVLERDELLLKLMECVGTADWLYIASISRRWRGLYFSFCTKKRSDDEQHLMRTCWAAVAMTAERLHFAFTSGLTVDTIDNDLFHFCEAVGGDSIAPIPVMTLARVRGVNWHEELCGSAAYIGNWALLKWLRESGCPWTLKNVYYNAMCRGIQDDTASALTWIKKQTEVPLQEDVLRQLIFAIGGYHLVDCLKWLRTELQAPWPTAFTGQCCFHKERICWCVGAVHYALKQGSEWGAWRCQDLKPELYTSEVWKAEAERLFDWAHDVAATHGFQCPCTCEEAAT